MEYLEDFLDSIEHIPEKFRDFSADLERRDRRINHDTVEVGQQADALFEKYSKVFGNQEASLEGDPEYMEILSRYGDILKNSDKQVNSSEAMYDHVTQSLKYLDSQLEKARPKVEAGKKGITAILERKYSETVKPGTSASAAIGVSAGPSVCPSAKVPARHKNARKHQGGSAKVGNPEQFESNLYLYNTFMEERRQLIEGSVKPLPSVRKRQKTSTSERALTRRHRRRSSSPSDELGTDADGNTPTAAAQHQMPVPQTNYWKTILICDEIDLIGSEGGPENNNSSSAIPQLASIRVQKVRAVKMVPPVAEVQVADISPLAMEGLLRSDPDPSSSLCSCKEKRSDSLIACSNMSCPIEWFHLSCIEILDTDRGLWYCNQCKQGTGEEKKDS